MPVEITGAWVRAEKGIGGRIVLGWFAPGPFDSQGEPFEAQDELKPRPPKERRRADPLFLGRKGRPPAINGGPLIVIYSRVPEMQVRNAGGQISRKTFSFQTLPVPFQSTFISSSVSLIGTERGLPSGPTIVTNVPEPNGTIESVDPMTYPATPLSKYAVS